MPNPETDDLSKAITLGWEILAQKIPREVVENGNVEHDKESNTFTVKMLENLYDVDLNNKSIIMSASEPGKESVPGYVVVLILHYLAQAKNIPFSDELTTFRQLPKGGDAYYPAFKNRAIDPLVEKFGKNPDELLQVATSKLGASVFDRGDASVKITVFSKIPVVIIIWEGEEEANIPPAANILFDRTASDHLPVEDLSVVGSIVSRKLVK